MFSFFCLPDLVGIINASYSDKQPPDLTHNTPVCLGHAMPAAGLLAWWNFFTIWSVSYWLPVTEDVDTPITSAVVTWCGQVVTSVSLVRQPAEPKLNYKGNWET